MIRRLFDKHGETLGVILGLSWFILSSVAVILFYRWVGGWLFF